MEQSNLIVDYLQVGELGTNCSLVIDRQTNIGAVVDPGGDGDLIIKQMNKYSGVQWKYILCTHGHFDHVLSAQQVKDKFGAVIKIHEKDKPLYMSMGLQMMFVGLKGPTKISPPDEFLQVGQQIGIGDGTILYTPGHTPGSVTFYWPSSKLLIPGDLIFNGSVGRTDLPGGSTEQLKESIKREILSKSDEVRIIPGHGPETTVGEERCNNEVLRQLGL